MQSCVSEGVTVKKYFWILNTAKLYCKDCTWRDITCIAGYKKDRATGRTTNELRFDSQQVQRIFFSLQCLTCFRNHYPLYLSPGQQAERESDLWYAQGQRLLYDIALLNTCVLYILWRDLKPVLSKKAGSSSLWNWEPSHLTKWGETSDSEDA
jgi:hypothetical protein